MNFEQMFLSHSGRRVDKWRHYFAIYDRHFAELWTRARRILEIGVDHGGSLQLWKRYFPNAEIVGVDIDPRCAEYVEDRITVKIGNQTDRVFLASLGEFDIIIDDGSHAPCDQAATFSFMWPRTKFVYLIEDCHTHKPTLPHSPPVVYQYPWVVVAEQAKRWIRGEPSRELRPEEIEAQNATDL
jgi:hypothetical protein